MKIKLSKSQWKEVGKKAGWMNKKAQEDEQNDTQKYKISDFVSFMRLLSSKKFGVAERSYPDGSREIILIFTGGKQATIKGNDSQPNGTWEITK
jgi:hypothetical protein